MKFSFSTYSLRRSAARRLLPIHQSSIIFYSAFFHIPCLDWLSGPNSEASKSAFLEHSTVIHCDHICKLHIYEYLHDFFRLWMAAKSYKTKTFCSHNSFAGPLRPNARDNPLDSEIIHVLLKFSTDLVILNLHLLLFIIQMPNERWRPKPSSMADWPWHRKSSSMGGTDSDVHPSSFFFKVILSNNWINSCSGDPVAYFEQVTCMHFRKPRKV